MVRNTAEKAAAGAVGQVHEVAEMTETTAAMRTVGVDSGTAKGPRKTYAPVQPSDAVVDSTVAEFEGLVIPVQSRRAVSYADAVQAV